MVDMLNKGVTPIIPEKGSLGASGDLAPLSHMVLPMIGLGLAEYEGEVLPGAEAMARAGIPTIELSAKESFWKAARIQHARAKSVYRMLIPYAAARRFTAQARMP